jgi:hypothetical protein
MVFSPRSELLFLVGDLVLEQLWQASSSSPISHMSADLGAMSLTHSFCAIGLQPFHSFSNGAFSKFGFRNAFLCSCAIEQLIRLGRKFQ